MKKYSKDSIGYKIPQGLTPDIKFTFIVLGYMVKGLSFFMRGETILFILVMT